MIENKNNYKKLFISQSLKTCSDFYQTSKFRTFSYNMKKKQNFNTRILSNYIKNHRNINKKYFDSFHKSLINRKLLLNPKFMEIDNNICYTDRNSITKQSHNNEKKKQIINKNNFQKLFITNDYDFITYRKKPINKSLKKLLLNENNIPNFEKFEKKNNNFHNIHSNIFLPINLNKMNNNKYTDIFCHTISDFIEEIKMVRKVKFINNIKTEQHKLVSSLVGLQDEHIDLTIHSLTNSIKLLDSYNLSFANYNKFLISEIKKEKKILENYIIDENIIKEQVLLLEKKFDDLMLEFEILNNFNVLLGAVKNRTRIANNDSSSKSFAEKTKERLRKKILYHKQNTGNFSSSRRLISKKKSIISNKVYINESPLKMKASTKSVSKMEKIEKKSQKKVKFQTILFLKPSNTNIKNATNDNNVNNANNANNANNGNNDNNANNVNNTSNVSNIKKVRRKFKRLNSLQPREIVDKKNIDNCKDKNIQFNNYDIHKELKMISDNILNLIEKYNDNECYIISYKLLFDKELNSINAMKMNQLIKEKQYFLDYNKKYNALLISKCKLLKCQKNDYSLFIYIYRKLNEIILLIKNYKIKRYQKIIDKLISVYDKNSIFNQYNNEKTGQYFRREFLEKELINYLYRVFIIIEKLVYKLIEGKNIYLKSNYYSERIEYYENKMDNDKKICNNRFKRDEESLRRKRINEKTKKKWEKILFKPRRKVVDKVFSDTHKKQKQKQETVNEMENLLFY